MICGLLFAYFSTKFLNVTRDGLRFSHNLGTQVSFFGRRDYWAL